VLDGLQVGRIFTIPSGTYSVNISDLTITNGKVTNNQSGGGISNGELLQLAAQHGFDLFIVADKNLRYQQNLTGRKLAILELWTNHRPTLERHLEKIRVAAEGVAAGAYVVL